MRSMASVVLGVGGLTLGVCSSRRGALRVSIRNRNMIGTTSMARSDSIRVLGPSLRVTALNSGTRLHVHLATEHKENCAPTSRGGERSRPVNIVPVSSVCAPMSHVSCRMRGAHINRVAGCSGLAFSI